MYTKAELRNMETVKNFLAKLFREKDIPAAAAMVTDGYIQHNPNVPTGKAGLVQGIGYLVSTFPDIRYEFKHIWADGNFVFALLHYVYSKNPNDRGSSIVDIYRFNDDGLAEEHWDVIQAVPEKMAHANGMF